MRESRVAQRSAHRGSNRHSVLMVVVLLLIRPDSLLADARRDYKEGLRAFDTGDWLSAAQKMSQALDQDPEERKRALAKDYFPHLYKGLALHRLGDCQGALESLRESESQKVVLKSPVFEDLLRIEDYCTEKLRAIKTARSKITEATEAAKRIEVMRNNPVLEGFWKAGQPSNEAVSRQQKSDTLGV